MSKRYERIAQLLDALRRCKAAGNTEWEDNHTDRLNGYTKELPSGSGFDAGTTLDMDKSTSERLVFNTSFHHMDENGYYCGWTEHTVIVTPSLAFGIDVRVTGKDKNDIKEYIADQFVGVLTEEE
jgi:hypothetical protein